MAAAEAKRDVCYFTFKDSRFVDDLYNIHTFLCDVQLTVGQYHWAIPEVTQRVYTCAETGQRGFLLNGRMRPTAS